MSSSRRDASLRNARADPLQPTLNMWLTARTSALGSRPAEVTSAANSLRSKGHYRWPHGDAYEYNPLFDPDWQKGEAPHQVGRPREAVTTAGAESTGFVGDPPLSDLGE
jgi:hypothetical protein